MSLLVDCHGRVSAVQNIPAGERNSLSDTIEKICSVRVDQNDSVMCITLDASRIQATALAATCYIIGDHNPTRIAILDFGSDVIRVASAANQAYKILAEMVRPAKTMAADLRTGISGQMNL